MKKQLKAFTLIELLVVIAIIAILAAILFPVFAQAKLAAKKTVALSNAKQVATANFIYMGDYDDALIKSFFGFPPGCDWGMQTQFYSWRYAMQPYTKSNGLLTDPTNPFTGDQYLVDTYTDPSSKTWKFSTNFAVNTDVIGFANGPCGGAFTPTGLDSINTVEDVAGTIVIMPSRARWNDLKPSFLSTIETKSGDSNTWCYWDGSAQTCPADPYGPINAVGKQVSWVWLDGHAKAKPPLATYDLNNPDRDDWASKLAMNPRTNAYYTKADLKQFADTAWAEYK